MRLTTIVGVAAATLAITLAPMTSALGRNAGTNSKTNKQIVSVSSSGAPDRIISDYRDSRTLTTRPKRVEAVSPVQSLKSSAAVTSYWSRSRMESARRNSSGLAKAQPRSGPAAAAGMPGSAVIGAVFYHNVVERKDKTCSASVVRTRSKSFILTAGHCVHGGRGGTWHQDFVFIPEYIKDHPLIHGVFVARQFTTFDWWVESSSYAHDVAFVEVYPNVDGVKVEDAVGGFHMGLFRPKSSTVVAIGYPADPATLKPVWQNYCGPTQSAPLGTTHIYINCRMLGGGSGGPWLIDYNKPGATPIVVGLFSQLYTWGKKVAESWSPYFGADVARLFGRICCRDIQ